MEQPPVPVAKPTKAVPLPPEKHRGLFGAAYRRRPILLVVLLAGLGAFLVWLPSEARSRLWVGLQAQRDAIALLLVFMLIALSLVWKTGQRFDQAIFLLFNLGGRHPGWLDQTMWVITQLGSMLAAFAAALVFVALGRRRLGAEITLGTLTLWSFVESVKLLTDRARPFLALEGTRIVGRRESGRSFPSGHTSQIFFMATVLARQLQWGAGPTTALYLIAALVGFTRIYVGAHYPRDVLGGAVLGTVWGMLMGLADPYLRSLGV